MAGERNYIRIPPESIGDRIHNSHTSVIPYTNLQNGQNFKSNDFYIIENGAGNIDVHVHLSIATTSTTGVLYVGYSSLDEWSGTTIDTGVRILNGLGTYIADVGTNFAEYDLYTNTSTIVGKDNPLYGANVDRYGGLYTRFAEGPPQITGYGQLRTSRQTLIAQYNFNTSAMYDSFASARRETVPGTNQAKSEWVENISAVRLTVANESTTPGHLVTHTSHMFHPVIPGSSTLFIMSNRTGDAGKTGVVREWGAFDSNEGFFFKLNDTNISVVHRYNLEGSINEYEISQTNWNRDTLDGSSNEENPSGMNLDVSKINMYWLDYQHLGGGRTRWGVYHKGERIVCHEQYLNNGETTQTENHNSLRNPNRPMCWATYNLDGVDPAGTQDSEFYVYGGSVYIESQIDIPEEGNVRNYFSDDLTLDANSNNLKYLFSLRPQLNIPGTSQENHSIYTPLKIEISSFDSSSSNANIIKLPVELRMYNRCVLRGTTYSPISFTTAETDLNGDHLAHGPEFLRKIVDGIETIDLTSIFDTTQTGTVLNRSDQTLAKQTQTLAWIESSNTSISPTTGNPSSYNIALPCTLIRVGDNSHPIWNNNRIYFEDKSLITMSNILTAGTLKNHLEGNNYYLSLLSGHSAMLYSSIAGIDDDRNARVITISANNQSFVVGDRITFDYDPTANCEVLQVVNATTLWVDRRTSSDIDTSMTSGNTFTFSTGGTGTVSAITLSGTTAYPKDYKTNLLAISNTNIQRLSEGELYGTPDPHSSWVFMAKPLVSHPTDITIRLNMSWKERAQ